MLAVYKVTTILILSLIILIFLPVHEIGDFDIYKYRLRIGENFYYKYLAFFDSFLGLSDFYVESNYFRLTPFSYKYYYISTDRLIIFLANLPFLIIFIHYSQRIIWHRTKLKLDYIYFFSPPIIILFSSPSIDVMFAAISMFCFHLLTHGRFIIALLISIFYFYYIGDKGMITTIVFLFFYLFLNFQRRNPLLILLLLVYLFLYSISFKYVVLNYLPLDNNFISILASQLDYGSYPLIGLFISFFTTNIFSYTQYFSIPLLLFIFIKYKTTLTKSFINLRLDIYLACFIFFTYFFANTSSYKYFPLFLIFYTLAISKKYIFLLILNLSFCIHLAITGLLI